MRFFKETDPYDDSQGDLSKRIHFLKCEEGGKDTMCKITEEFFQEGRQEGREEERLESIRNIMDSINCSANHAMKLLKIPEDEQLKYIKLIGKKEIV